MTSGYSLPSMTSKASVLSFCPKISLFGWEIPFRVLNLSAAVLSHSSCAPPWFGPKTRIPAFLKRSASPLQSGSSGQMTTSLIAFARINAIKASIFSDISVGLVTATFGHCITWFHSASIHGFPGKTYTVHPSDTIL